jgi:hypothetical protein
MSIKANLVLDQATSFRTTLNIRDNDGNIVDLTGYTGSAEMKKHFLSSTFYTFTVILNIQQGSVSIDMTHIQTSAIPDGRYVYDVLLRDNNGYFIRIMEGQVDVRPKVTRVFI